MPIDTSYIRTAFQEAKGPNGKIDGPKADKLIRLVRADRLTESEADAFKREVARYKSAFTKDATSKIEKFIKGTMKKIEILDPGHRGQVGPLKDPPVLKADRDKLEQENVKNAQIFKNGVSGTDPQQNYIGDCYLMAAMSAVAKMQPAQIKKMFRPSKEKPGVWIVRLWDKKRGKLVPHDVEIDLDLPKNGWLGYSYARAKDPRELWPALLEKAFAVRAGSYAKIESGVPGDAMESITGKRSTEIELRSKGMTADKIFMQMQLAEHAGKPMTAATLSDSSNAKYAGTNIYADHTYSVFGVSVDGGKKYVHLRNPWGESEPKGNGRDDGIFKLELSKFMDLYSDVAING